MRPCCSVTAFAQIDGDLHAEQDRAREDRCLHVGADRHHDAVELVDGELAQRLLLRRVGAHDLGELAVVRLDELLVGVDAEHLGAGGHEFEREGAAEASQPDDGDRVGLGDTPRGVAEESESSQWRAFPSGIRRGSAGRAGRGRSRS